MVRDVNRTVVDTKDLLSDHVYRYNSKAGTIRMVEPKQDVPEIKRSLESNFM